MLWNGWPCGVYSAPWRSYCRDWSWFGRLADLYAGYDQVILFDYSRTLLQEAAPREWGHDPRFVFVAGNVYSLPPGGWRAGHTCDGAGNASPGRCIRCAGSTAAGVTPAQCRRNQYANKRNLKAMLRWLLGQQRWSPLTQEPVEFVRLNYDFHPDWMTARFAAAGLRIRQRYAVSHFRLPGLKARVAPERLAQIDSWLFTAGGRLPLAPSVFLQATAAGSWSTPCAFNCAGCRQADLVLYALSAAGIGGGSRRFAPL